MNNNICSQEKDSGILNVDCGDLKCGFFPGHLFPVYFNLSGVSFPSVIFRDYVEYGGHTYFAAEERWGTWEILQNSDSRFVITTRGHFCRSDTPMFVEALKELPCSFTYSFVKDSDIVEMEISLTGKPESPICAGLCMPQWRLEKQSCAAPLNGCAILHTPIQTATSDFKATAKLHFNIIQ